MTIKPGVYQKLRGLYGKHVDQIELQSRINRQTINYEYSATCSSHGLIMDWTGAKDEVSIQVRDHLKGIS